MYSFPNLETVCCSMSISNCCFLTFIQITQETCKVIWYSHLFKNFPVCHDPHSQRLWHLNKAKIMFFLELSCFFNDPMDVGNLISGSSVFLNPACTSVKSSIHILMKPSLKDFECYLASM